MGAYHGKSTFDTFTHKKSVLEKNFNGMIDSLTAYDLISLKTGLFYLIFCFRLRYPPYTEKNLTYMKMLLKKRSGPMILRYWRYFIVFGLGLGCAFAINAISKVEY